MRLDRDILLWLSRKFGDAFYLLDLDRFSFNYSNLLTALSAQYPSSCIAYSYKTNYIPAICKQLDMLGGYAEVVSEMEYELAERIGVASDKIILNGPLKKFAAVEKLLLAGGQVNIDSACELEMLEEICRLHPESQFAVGIRCNFDVSDGMVSRFGIDVESPEFERVLRFVKEHRGLKLTGLHCHFAARSLDIWRNKVSRMLGLLKRQDLQDIESVDLGGGLYGGMADSLKKQFPSPIPSFEEYAEVIAAPFAAHYKGCVHPPKLLIEPGSALAGDCMNFVSRVVSIKTVREKPIATLSGSMYNINPTLSRKNLPVSVFHSRDGQCRFYTGLDFGGYTCIESDYLYRGYTGELETGDFVVFDNVGSYSVVLKPPFILPNFPVVCIDGQSGSVRMIKKAEGFDDIFSTYVFN